MLSIRINPYPSICHSYLYVICLTLGTAVVVDYKQGKAAPFVFKNSIQTAMKWHIQPFLETEGMSDSL